MPFLIKDTLPRHRGLPTRAAGQEILVREPDNGSVHFLNATAAVIWNCCDGQTSVQDCANRLREIFDIPTEIDLTTDIHEVITDLTRRGLFEKDDAGA